MQEEFIEIAALKDKIVEIISMYESQKQLNSILNKDNENLLKEIELKNSNINELEKDYETLKFAKSITASSKDTHDAKIKINKLVREIDKCIGLLNK